MTSAVVSISLPLRYDLNDIVKDIRKRDNAAAIRKIEANLSLIYFVDYELEWSLLAYAIYYNNQELVDFLLKHMECDVLIGGYRETSIIFCVGISRTESTLRKLILKFPKTINETDKLKNCALSHVITNREYEMTQILLEAGADMHLVTTNGKGEETTLLDVVYLWNDAKMIAIFNTYKK